MLRENEIKLIKEPILFYTSSECSVSILRPWRLELNVKTQTRAAEIVILRLSFRIWALRNNVFKRVSILFIRSYMSKGMQVDPYSMWWHILHPTLGFTPLCWSTTGCSNNPPTRGEDLISTLEGKNTQRGHQSCPVAVKHWLILLWLASKHQQTAS